MLDHLKATKRNVADRYVLGELSQAQREEFEDHYFECVDCAEDVRAFLAISSNSRSVLVDVPDYEVPAPGPVGTRLGWFQALLSWRPPAIYTIPPALAMLALTVMTTYQTITLRTQLVAQSVPQFALRPEARGDDGEISIKKQGPFVLLTADVPGAPRATKWKIRGIASPAPLMEGTAPAPVPGSSLSVLIPTSKLGTGQFVLVLCPDGMPQETGPEVLYRFRMH